MTDLGYRLASLLVRRLPACAVEPLLHAISDCYVFTHPGRARAVDRNLAWIWSESGRAGAPPRAQETYRAFSRALGDFLAHQPGRGPRVRLSESALEALQEARRSSCGAVLVSGHFGPWERALQWLAGELGGVEALAARHRMGGVDRFFIRQRERGGVRTLCMSRPVRSALRTLQAGGWIATLVDRPRQGRQAGGIAWPEGARAKGTDPTRKEGIVPIDRGPLLLARRAEALILPGVSAFARDGAMEIDFDTPFTLGSGRGALGLTEAIARLQRFFDAHVRAYPTQWFTWGSAVRLDVPARGS